jgi:hypothetical protein
MFLKDALATVKDAPLTLLTQPNRLAKAPPWAAQLAEVLTTRSADKLRKLASQAGWLVQFPFEKSPYATKIDNRVQ